MALVTTEGLPIFQVEYPSFRAALDARPDLEAGYVQRPRSYEAAAYDPSSGICLVCRLERVSPRTPDLEDFEDSLVPLPRVSPVAQLDDFLAVQVVTAGRPGTVASRPLLVSDHAAEERRAPLAPLDCSAGPVRVEVGSSDHHNEFRFLGLKFSSADAKEVSVRVAFGPSAPPGKEWEWIKFADATGEDFVTTEAVGGNNARLVVEVSQHAGTLDYLAVYKRRPLA